MKDNVINIESDLWFDEHIEFARSVMKHYTDKGLALSDAQSREIALITRVRGLEKRLDTFETLLKVRT